MTDEILLAWWRGLDPDLRDRARAVALRPAPRGLPIDALVASMAAAGVPTSRQIWTGQPEFLAEMLDEVADFVSRQPA